MLCGGCDSDGTYVWSGFDAMRVLNRKSNDTPEKGSRPMSATAAGFVPGGGAGALVLEDLETALARGARIYGEVLGGYVNSGGQQNGGSITAPNPDGIVRCIQGALQDAEIDASAIDAISGHLTATMFDPYEIALWSKALGRKGKDFPYIASLKSMIGHCLSAAGAIESVAAVLELYKGFLHPSINCEDLHPKITEVIDSQCIPTTAKDIDLNIIAKSSFGFGDVNSVVIFKKY
jgi:3-oxoacyl-(acyl-carrier-protein) synthase